MTAFVQDVVNALSLGSVYALVALGISLQFGIMKLINFAHGELIMIAGYTLVAFGGHVWLLAVFAAVAAAGVAAVVMERVAFRPVRGSDPSTMLVTSFAVSVLLQSLAIFALGAQSRPIVWPGFVGDSLHVFGIQLQLLDLIGIAVAALALAAVSLFLFRTSAGVQMRAVAEDFGMARHVGVRANRTVATAFGLSGVLAGLAGAIYLAQTASVNPTVGLQIVVVGFVASVLGGISSLRGAVVGGLLLGALTVALQVVLPESVRGARDAFVLLIVLGVLVLRPQGLFGDRAVFGPLGRS
ncbi:branched-chain amino acid ABC transporter permease [Conexibacter sp. CPCC 206217]|uniref:branched-chain amino acid ABC transporter permease n=1 Tax=Conexibacter sp. CPCC 206217 TaxID=3064574 RepID=UPI00271851E2|nr:branched-chain amino acid ABC transporter permease [Conexibacter sp. CPCC 206217]MDO8208806.1 branched-chain amino acid ABC transporter permease [Conexibacter sp. CPCC 206217]